MMTYTLRAINADGTTAGFLPDHDKVSLNVTFSDIGSFSLDYAVNGVNASLVADQREVAVFYDDLEVADTRCVIEGSNGMRVAPEGELYRKYKGRNLWKLFGESLVYVQTWPTSPGTGSVGFTQQNAGVILKTLIDRAQALGELPGITYNFTNTLDSKGAAWAYQVNIAYEMGVSLVQVMQNLVDQGMIEVRLVGRQLQAYNPNTLGTDRTTGANPMILWGGRNVLEAPEETESSGLRTVALVKGDNDVYTEVVDATAVAKYGRRAMYVSQGGVNDAGTLTVIGQANVDRSKEVRSELTYKYVPGDGAPVPLKDFIPGDWVLTDITGTFVRVRVRQVVIEWDADGGETYTLVLNDKFLENEIMLNRRVEGITNGATLSGSPLPTPADPGKDTVAPAVPTGLALSSLAYADNSGQTFAQASASWVQVTANADGTSMDDFDHYEVNWRYTNDPQTNPRNLLTTTNTSVTWSPLNPGVQIAVKVLAVDRAGNRSPYTAEVLITTGSDATPPPVPSTPVLSTPFPGSVRVTWNGLGSAGEAMPVDFKFTEVHFSTVSNFTPSNTTLYDRLDGPTISNIAGLTNTAIFVRLVSVDQLNNKSAASAQATITPTQVGVQNVNFTSFDIGGIQTYIQSTAPTGTIATGSVWIDTANSNEPKRWSGTAWVTARDIVPITASRLAAGAIAAGSAVIADAAIRTAQIGLLQVTDALIGSVSVGKLTAGLLQADMTVSARIKTADTGARVELNNTGLKKYAADGTTVLVNIGPSGNAQFQGDITASTMTGGTVQTAASGSRVRLNDAGGLVSFRQDGSVQFQIYNGGVSVLDAVDGAYVGINAGIRFGGGGTAGFINKQDAASCLSFRAGNIGVGTGPGTGAGLDAFDDEAPGADGDGDVYSQSLRFYTNGQTRLKITKVGDLVLQEGLYSTVMRAITVGAGTVTGPRTLTTYTVINGWTIQTFVAPPSGCVQITVDSLLRSTDVGTFAQCGIEVRTGSVQGAGTIVSSPTNTTLSSNVGWSRQSGTIRVTGLTPGGTYHARPLYSSNGAGVGEAYVSHTILTIHPLM